MGHERIDEDPIQMQPVLSLNPKAVQDELDGGQSRRYRHGDGVAPPGDHAGDDGSVPPS
jgi:hypothetical protein